jgi:hypothetical protein
MEWYHVNEAIPDFCVDILATDGESIFIAHLMSGLTYPIWFNEQAEMVEVTHWMFLPELPEVK